jgi:hypothetical protein
MKCAVCGQEHPDDDIELTYVRPDDIFRVPEDQRAVRVRESPDFAVLDDSRFFIRTTLPIPVRGRKRDYHIGVWAEVDEAAFRRIVQRWQDVDQGDEPALPARLANAIKSLPDTLGLPVELRLTGLSARPRVRVLAADHPLHAEQAHGISVHRTQDYRAG